MTPRRASWRSWSAATLASPESRGDKVSVQLFPEATEEQHLMADSAIRVMEAEYPLTAVREAAEGSGPADEKLWRALGGLGCYGLLASEDDGGGSLSGNGVADAAILAAERGARLQPGPFVGT